MIGLLQNIDRSMLIKLVLLHVAIITVSNAIVSSTFTLAGFVISWSALTFPLVVLATDLTVRLLGKETARATIAFAYPFAIIASIAVVLASGAPESVALRIGFASATAYAVGTLLDVFVFQHIREKWTNNWWAAPAISTVAATIIDTYTFFSVAFHGSADEFMSANWLLVAHSQVGIKIAIGLIIFLPLYGVFLNYLKRYLNDTRNG
jgi:uncharacterized integral membrane protein (TIGR00697 family)